MNAPQTIADGLALAAERDALVVKLEARWRWLGENPGHPKYREREDLALEDLGVYELMEDALRAGAANQFGGAVEWV